MVRVPGYKHLYAALVQMVERHLAKVKATGSIPVCCSKAKIKVEKLFVVMCLNKDTRETTSTYAHSSAE